MEGGDVRHDARERLCLEADLDMLGVFRLDRRKVEHRLVGAVERNAVVVQAERLERCRIGGVGVIIGFGSVLL